MNRLWRSYAAVIGTVLRSPLIALVLLAQIEHLADAATRGGYHGAGRMATLTEEPTPPPVPATMHLRYTYDAANWRTRLTYADGKTASWGYARRAARTR